MTDFQTVNVSELVSTKALSLQAKFIFALIPFRFLSLLMCGFLIDERGPYLSSTKRIDVDTQNGTVDFLSM